MADLRPILDTAPVDNTVKRKAWDAWHAAETPEQFRAAFDDMPLPAETKRALWDKKFSQTPAAPPPSREGLISRIGTDLSIGYRTGKADLAHTAANVASLIPATRDIGKSYEESAERLRPSGTELESHSGVLDRVVQAGGELPTQALKYLPAAALKGWRGAAAGGLISAAGEIDKGPKEALKAGLTSAAQWYALHKAGKIKRLPGRVAASAAIMGVPTAVQTGGDVTATTTAALVGGLGGVAAAHERLTPTKAREALKGGLDTAAALKHELLSSFGPQKIDNLAKITTEVLTERMAEKELVKARADYALREARKHFDNLPPDEIQEFLRNVETRSGGARGSVSNPVSRSLAPSKQVNPKLRELEDTMGKIYDSNRDEVTAETGKLKDYYVDYWKHIWKDPEKAAEFSRNFYGGKRPLKGPGTSFRQRKYPTIEDGIKFGGLELEHSNPVDTVIAATSEMQRFIMAKRVIKDLRPQTAKNPGGRGILRLAKYDENNKLIVPRGFRVVEDPAFDVYAPASKRVRTDKGLATPTAKSRPQSKMIGKWVAPDGAAQVFNNYLSSGLSKSKLYKIARGVGNTLNQAQLGISGFHMGFTAIDAATSSFAIGLEKVMEGVRSGNIGMIARGGVDIIKTPVAPIITVFKGADIRKALRDPAYAAAHPHLAAVTEWTKMAGGRADVDPVYKNNLWRSMSKSYRQNDHLLTFFKLPGALIEASAAPLMDHFVPNMKLGVFSDMARFAIEKLGPDATRDEQRTVLQGAWRSVDNRMGQLVYDNLMWNKTAKDLGMLAVRSVGWNLGTVRELAGGAKDWASFFNNLPRSGRTADFTHRMAYTVALPVMVGTMGAITNYLFTGEWPDVKKYGYKDYLAPRTGHKDEFGHDERIWFPSYLKDIYHYATDPLQTVKGKFHPMFGMIADMMNNEDFYGVEIANHNDPFLSQLMSYAGYTAEQFSPLSFRTAAQREEGPETPLVQKLGSFVGITPAPATLKKSTAENYAARILAGRGQKGARTQEQAERRKALQQIKAAWRAGTDPTPFINQAIRDGILAPENIHKAGKTISFSPLFNDVKLLDIHEAINTFRLATPTERVELLPIIQMKLRNEWRQIKNLPQKDRERIAGEARSIMSLPVGGGK